MITCCPACSTLFKVGTEQLRVAEGWVRCGQCMAVFDARSRMLPADPYVPSGTDWSEEPHPPQSTQPAVLEGAAMGLAPGAEPGGNPPAPAAQDRAALTSGGATAPTTQEQPLAPSAQATQDFQLSPVTQAPAAGPNPATSDSAFFAKTAPSPLRPPPPAQGPLAPSAPVFAPAAKPPTGAPYRPPVIPQPGTIFAAQTAPAPLQGGGAGPSFAPTPVPSTAPASSRAAGQEAPATPGAGARVALDQLATPFPPLFPGGFAPAATGELFGGAQSASAERSAQGGGASFAESLQEMGTTYSADVFPQQGLAARSQADLFARSAPGEGSTGSQARGSRGSRSEASRRRSHAQQHQPSSGSSPTREELDRRYAKLLDTLAKLREAADSKLSDSQITLPPLEDPAVGTGRSEPAPERGRGQKRGGAGRTEPVLDALPTIAAQSKGRSRRRAKDPRLSGVEPHLSISPDLDDDLNSRPMIDFVFSEMAPSRSHSPPPARRSTRESDRRISRSSQRPAAQPSLSRALVVTRSSRHDPGFDPSTQELPAVGFLDRARKNVVIDSAPARMIMVALSALLGIALVLQITLGLRNYLAAHFPTIEPALSTLCQPFGCEVTPWRNLSALDIDSSSFVLTSAGTFNFSITLRNNSTYKVATPYLELTLVDDQELPLGRRVVSPIDWGAPGELAGYGEFSGAGVLTVERAASPELVKNYRLTAFYP